MRIGEIIKSYRMQKKLSIREFARKCDVSFGYISMLESGKNPRSDKPLTPALTVLNKLAIGMDMTVDQLIEMSDDMDVNITPLRISLDSSKMGDIFAGIPLPSFESLLQYFIEDDDEEKAKIVIGIIEEVKEMDIERLQKMLSFARFIKMESEEK